jgi:peptidoglycan/LPS O-acetylase OafA/YrhL
MQPHFSQRIDAIDGMRAIAVIAVILYHLSPGLLPGGYTGVDVFFVISGFVVCRSLLASPTEPIIKRFGRFYARRLLRIYPPLLAMVMITAIAYKVFAPPAGLGYTSMDTAFYGLYGFSNVYLSSSSINDYFGESSDFNPFVHKWSLGVEEQFYLLIPALVIFAVYRGANAVHGPLMIAALLIGAISLVSFAWCSHLTAARPLAAFYLLPSRFWELGAGVILALVTNGRRVDIGHRFRFHWVSFVGPLLVMLGFVRAYPFPYPSAILPVVGAVLWIASIVYQEEASSVNRLAGSSIVAWVGRLSYSLYLWHWPVIVLMRWTIGIEGIGMKSLACLLFSGLAIVSYYGLERVSNRIQRLLDGELLLGVSIPRRATDLSDKLVCLPIMPVVLCVGMLSIVACSYAIGRVNSSRRIGQSIITRDAWDNPWIPRSPVLPLGVMNIGEAEREWSDRKLFVIGDSHAEGYSEMLSMLRRDKGVSVYIEGRGGVRVGSFIKRQTTVDKELQRNFLDYVSRHANRGDVVFLAALRVERLCNQDYAIPMEEAIARRDSPEAEAERLDALEEGSLLIKELADLGLEVVVEAPKPVFKAPPFRISDWFNHMNPVGRGGLTIDREFVLRHRESAMKSIEFIKRRFGNVHVWDPLPILCPDSSCSAFDGELPLFFDGDHLSSYGNRKLYPDFVRTMQRIWGIETDTDGI